MYYPGFYKGLNEREIFNSITGEGFNPVIISNESGYIYHEHEHPETKLLAFISGSMELKFSGKTYNCITGDKVIVPGNTNHSAIVGRNGCTFFWSEKLM